MEEYSLNTSLRVSAPPPALSKSEIERIIKGKSEAEYDRLRGMPGYVLEPVPWDRLTRLIEVDHLTGPIPGLVNVYTVL